MAHVTQSASEAHVSATERVQSGAFTPCLAVLHGLATMPYARIDLDVHMAEEAELWRLESQSGCA